MHLLFITWRSKKRFNLKISKPTFKLSTSRSIMVFSHRGVFHVLRNSFWLGWANQARDRCSHWSWVHLSRWFWWVCCFFVSPLSLRDLLIYVDWDSFVLLFSLYSLLLAAFFGWRDAYLLFLFCFDSLELASTICWFIRSFLPFIANK